MYYLDKSYCNNVSNNSGDFYLFSWHQIRYQKWSQAHRAQLDRTLFNIEKNRGLLIAVMTGGTTDNSPAGTFGEQIKATCDWSQICQLNCSDSVPVAVANGNSSLLVWFDVKGR